MAIILKPQSQEPRQRWALVSAVSMLWAEVKTNAILSCDFHVVFYSRLLSDPRVEKKKELQKELLFSIHLNFQRSTSGQASTWAVQRVCQGCCPLSGRVKWIAASMCSILDLSYMF